LHTLIFDSWREGKDGPHPGWDKDGPLPGREHVPGQDPTSLFLARITIPAAAAGAPNTRPIRDLGANVLVNNQLRQFVYSPAALAGWLGIGGFRRTCDVRSNSGTGKRAALVARARRPGSDSADARERYGDHRRPPQAQQLF